MYLKELTLKGFKSFASATTLRFEPGITAVVGPNGSGKSNIVDALTWVMGEQGAKNLRGTSMEDVIFAGTSSRPPLGRAQVSLTIDNTDGTLDIDYTEVTISRTIYRNGGSEYAINGSSCRLLDIQELLSDTGLGQQMHVIVGQGRLDEILKADPAGHRAFIEEAAGILKHRKRKERALKKLKNTEDNLARIDDLLREIHRQLGPLGRQAKISRRAAGIQVSLRDAQARIYADDAKRALAARANIRERLGQVRGQLETAQRSLAELKVRIEQVEALSSSANPAIAKLNETWSDLTRLTEQFKSVASLAEERARSAEGRKVSNFGEDPDLLESRAAELDGQAERQQAVVADARMAFDKATEARADDEKQLAASRQTLAELRKAVERHTSQVSSLRELKTKEEAAIELAERRSKDYASQKVSLVEQRDAAEAQREQLELEVQRNQESADGKVDGLDEAKAELAQRRERLQDLQAQLRDINGKITALEAKAEALDDTLESRNASGALEDDEHLGTLGRLTDFIRVEAGFEEAVAHALDQFASAVVVSDGARMLEALRVAENKQLGKAVVLHPHDGRANAAGGAFDDAKGPELNEDGMPVLAVGQTLDASGLVSANPSAADTALAASVAESVRTLLRGVAVAGDLDTAFEAVESDRFVTAVTLSGQLVNAVGAVGGSSRSQSDLSLAARRDAATSQAVELRRQIGPVKHQIEEAKSLRDKAATEVDRYTQARIQAELNTKQAQSNLEAVIGRVASLDRQIAGLDAKVKELDDERQTHELKLVDLNNSLNQAESESADGVDLNDLEGRVRRLEQALDVTREHELSAKVEWNTAKAKADSLVRQAGLLHDNARAAVERRAQLKALNERRERECVHAKEVAADAWGMASMVEAELAAVVAKRDEMTAAASSHDAELKNLRAKRDEAEPHVDQLREQEHQLDVERERLAAQYGQIEQKVSDTLGMNVDELVGGYGPDQPVPLLDDNGEPIPIDVDADRVGGGEVDSGDGDYAPDGRRLDNEVSEDAQHPAESTRFRTVPYVRDEQVKRLAKAERDLKALGKINPLATEEFDALEARNQYLNNQRNDVAQSRDDLLKLIKDLDRTMIEVFKDAFDDTATAFGQVFATLFPGGTGRLRLENPDDLLSTGVIVEASPAGKRVKQLSLLSGGERSLTALALLFAIFTARPSPFYVMDEVEAALDDINLTRLINALNDLRQHAQLIVITHQQRTMAIADALYGVTMRTDGVTAVISQKLEHEQR
jgi:chromosome segregation protein